MAAPTQLDRIEAAIAALAAKATRIDLEQQQQTNLLNAISTGVQIMSMTADQTSAALDAKVDNLIAAIQPGLQVLRDQLAAAQTQIADLQAGDAADVVTLTATIAAAQAETAKVQTAIDALTPAG